MGLLQWKPDRFRCALLLSKCAQAGGPHGSGSSISPGSHSHHRPHPLAALWGRDGLPAALLRPQTQPRRGALERRESKREGRSSLGPHLLRTTGSGCDRHFAVRARNLSILHVLLHPPSLQRHLPTPPSDTERRYPGRKAGGGGKPGHVSSARLQSRLWLLQRREHSTMPTDSTMLCTEGEKAAERKSG